MTKITEPVVLSCLEAFQTYVAAKGEAVTAMECALARFVELSRTANPPEQLFDITVPPRLRKFPVTPPLHSERAVLVHQDYAPLFDVLALALAQAQDGKGRERHGNGLPFMDQPMIRLGRMTGPGGPAFQAMKKAQEALGMAGRGEREAAERELLGAINYLAGAVLLVREGVE